MFLVPAALLAGTVNVTEQSLVPSAFPASEQVVGLKVPVPLALKLIVPSGSLAVPTPAASDTVAVQVVPVPASMEAGRQLTLVDVARVLTVCDAVPLDPTKFELPAYVAVRVFVPAPP